MTVGLPYAIDDSSILGDLQAGLYRVEREAEYGSYEGRRSSADSRAMLVYPLFELKWQLHPRNPCARALAAARELPVHLIAASLLSWARVWP